MTIISLSTPISSLFMVGTTYAKRLKKLGIGTVEDLLHHYPFRYDDFSLISNVSEVQIGETVTIRGKITSFQNIYTKYGKRIQQAQIIDETGQIEAIWFNQPFLKNIMKPDLDISLSGKVDWFNRKPAIISPEYEISPNRGVACQPHRVWITLHTGRLVPIYPETYGVSSKWLRSRIAPLLNKFDFLIPDWLPEEIKKQNGLISLNPALKQIHFPQNQLEIYEAKKRLSFDELFLIQLKTQMQKQAWKKTKLAHAFIIYQEKLNKFIGSLPFKLTNSQTKALKEIISDLTRKQAMNRLLEGDVGSGKTVVAAIAMYLAYLNGFQSILMAPTEILSQQHYLTVKQLLEPFGLKIALLTGSNKSLITNHQSLIPDILIGTHALLYTKEPLPNLGLIVIDEQHRFGVEQRAKLITKGQSPHLLTMTATPIPRTVALTLYGDLDLSVLEEMPLGRKIVKTWVVPQEKRQAAYNWIMEQINTVLPGRNQAFIVCPLIEQSEKESMAQIKAVKAEYEHLAKKIFPQFRLGFLHGRLKSKEKEQVIKDFKNQKLDILVSTPVVEVGIDIPNATIMLIEGAERFGLAQLHQLRGRVGRAEKQSYCLLFTTDKKKESLKRLQSLQNIYSGFKLAEIDLKLRGAGEIYGVKQHGFSELKIASFTNAPLIEQTRITASAFVTKLNQFPLLKSKLKSYKMKNIEPN